MKKQRYSRKREEILRVIRSTDIHPSAEWVYARLKDELPDLSLGTVYRNIAMFRASGEIVAIAVVNGQERFDGNTSEHAHFICETCGAVIDIFDLPPLNSDCVEELAGALVTHCSVTYYGSCAECRNALSQSRNDGFDVQ